MIGYGLSVALSAVVTLISIPILVGSVGADSWAALVVGQAVGTGAAVLIGFGWGTTGPTHIARAQPDLRRTIYLESFLARILLSVPILSAAVVITLFVARTVPVEAAANALGYGATGLLSGWYFTGVSRPYMFLLLDTAPRVLGAGLGIAVVAAGAPLGWFLGSQLAGIVAGILLSTLFITGRKSPPDGRLSNRNPRIVLREQSHGLVIAIVAASISSIPAVLVSTLAPASLPAYALCDKLLRFGTTAFAPIVQFLQGWVPRSSIAETQARVRRAFYSGSSLAVIGGIGFLVLAPFLAKFLSSGKVFPPPLMFLAFSIALVLMVVAQITGLVCLLALDRAHKLAFYSTVGVLVTLPAVFFGALFWGGTGAAWMLAIGEGVSLLPQLLLLRRSLKLT